MIYPQPELRFKADAYQFLVGFLVMVLLIGYLGQRKTIDKLHSKNADLITERVRDVQKLQRFGIENRILKDRLDTEVLWLTRALVSESNREEEWPFVAWVVRNRVERGFRGKTTYEAVIKDPYQFSAFNPGTRTSFRFKNANIDNYPWPGHWHKAESVAREVILAEDSENPFPNATHFLSPVSMRSRGYNWPRWYREFERIEVREVDGDRFQFFSDQT